MCICICPYHISAALVSHLLKVVPKFGYLWKGALEQSVVVEVIDPFKWAPTSMSNKNGVLRP
jgi:hypothetical protein